MGDRCYLRVEVLESDRQRLVDFEESWSVSMTRTGKVIAMEDIDANYGRTDELKQLAKQGLVFLGYHTEGGEYPGECFVAFGGELLTCDAIGGEEVIAVDANGPNQEQLRKAMEYFAARAKVLAIFDAAK